MAKSTASNLLLRSPMFRMSYPNLIEARPYKDANGPKGEPRFDCECIFDPDALDKFMVRRGEEWVEANLKALMVEVAKAEWSGIDVKAAVANHGLGWPIVSGDKKVETAAAKGRKAEHYAGKVILPVKSSNKFPPTLNRVKDGKIVELRRSDAADMTEAKELFQAGAFAKGSFNLKAVEMAGSKYIVVYANAFLFVKPGPRIGGISAEERFGGVEGGESSYDPTEGMDDEIPY